MTILQAVAYGIVQGLTEWLPISSTAHLRILPSLAGWDEPGAAFTAVIQLGTMVALFIYFWKDIQRVFTGWVSSLTGKTERHSLEARMGWAIVWGTIPVVVLALLLKKHVEGDFRSLYVISGSLIVMALLMYVAELKAANHMSLDDVQPKHGLGMGLFQALALIPGMSRSGSTITGGLFMGFDRVAAARMSFLLSIPSVTLAGLKELFDERQHLGRLGTANVFVATFVSFVVGYATIAWLLKFIQNNKFTSFVIYRIVLAVVLLVLIQQGILHPNAQ